MRELKKSWSDRHHDKFLIELRKIYKYGEHINTTQFIKQIKVIEEYSIDKNRIFALFSQIDFYFLYLSKSLENTTGYTPAEIYKKGLPFAFKIVHWKQLPLAIKINQWGNVYQKILKKQGIPITKQEAFFCGIKLKDKQGQWKIFFLKQKILTANKVGKPVLSFMEIEDITALYKSDYGWARFSVLMEDTTIDRAYFQDSKKKEYADVLSKREIEILRLIIAKKDNVAISEILSISKNTVERHRKNMIARLGVTDMTALIHICQLCQVL